jgi:hypothetical protein
MAAASSATSVHDFIVKGCSGRRERRLTLVLGWSPGLSRGDGGESGECSVHDSEEDEVEEFWKSLSEDGISSSRKPSASLGRFWVTSAEEGVVSDAVSDDGLGTMGSSAEGGLPVREMSGEFSSVASNSPNMVSSQSVNKNSEWRRKASVQNPRDGQNADDGRNQRAWQGPLPRPRRSPNFSFGVALRKAQSVPFHSRRSWQGPRKEDSMGSSPPTDSPRKTMSHPIPVGPTLLGPRSFDVVREAGGDETLPRVVQQSGGPVINSEAGFRRVTNQIVPYKMPLGLVALFENAHSSQQLRRALVTRHKHPGHASYAAAAMDRRPPPQQPQPAQGGFLWSW